MSTIVKTLKLFLLRIIKSLIVLISLSLSSNYFGVNIARDNWLLAYSCILIVDLAVWGALNETFRAKFIFLKETEGEVSAITGLNSLLFYTSLITLFIFSFFFIFPTIPAQVLAPTYEGKQLDELKFMLQLLAPSILINQTTQLLVSVLNGYNIFFIPEYAGFISSIFNIISLVILVPYIGIYSLVVSYYISLIILFIMLIYQIKYSRIPLLNNWRNIKIGHIKPYIIFALPFYIPYIGGQLNAIIEKSLGSTIAVGAVSSIDYARKFVDIPSSTLTSVLTTILIPVLSEKFAKNKLFEFTNELRKILQIGLIMLGGLTGILVVSGEDIVNMLYNNGTIPKPSLKTIYILAVTYSISSLSVFLYTTFGLAHLSSQQGKVYAAWGISAQLMMIAINILMYKKIGIYIFPISLAIAHLVAAFCMRINFKKSSLKLIDRSVLKYLCIISCWIIAAYVIKYTGNALLIYLDTLLVFLVKLTFLLLIVLMSIMLFDLEEKQMIQDKIKGLIIKNR